MGEYRILSKEVGKQLPCYGQIELWDFTQWRVVCDFTSQWEVWDYIQWRVVCDVTSHHHEKCETIMKGGVWLYITSQWEVWDYIQWRVVCDLTSHHHEKCETIWEVWDYLQWRVVCDFTSHHNEKCETTFNEGWCVTLHHITMRSVRLYSMQGGVWLDITWQWEVWDYTQWRVVCDLTSHHNEKCETTFNERWQNAL